MTHFALKDELLDAQTLRARWTSLYGGADIGECLTTAAAVGGTDLTSWHRAWTSTAVSALSLAEREKTAGRLGECPSGLLPGVDVISAPRESCCWDDRWTGAWSRVTHSRPLPSGQVPPCSLYPRRYSPSRTRAPRSRAISSRLA